MFVLMLLQSCTHVDTVRTVFHDFAILSHICWGRKMKVLGSHVTFVGRSSVAPINSNHMCIVTEMPSRTHVNSVQTVLHSIYNSRRIRWSHTVKILSLCVTFVRRNLANLLCWRSIYLVMYVRSYMFAVNVQGVTIQLMTWAVICLCIRSLNSFAAVCVVNILNVRRALCDIWIHMNPANFSACLLWCNTNSHLFPRSLMVFYRDSVLMVMTSDIMAREGG